MSDFSPRTFTLRNVLAILGVCVLIALLLTYVTYQARSFLRGPLIELTDTYTTVHYEQEHVITGQAHNIVRLTVNGKEITTSATGAFNHTVILENGYGVILLEAWDRFGRTTAITREYVYVEEEMPTDTTE